MTPSILMYFIDCYRNKLHSGVYRDIARQEERRFENMYILEQQRELTKKLRESEQQMNTAKE